MVGPAFARDTTPLIEHESTSAALSIPRLIALTISFLGVQFGWALQIAYASPIFLELGVSSFWVSFVWLAGPISGLLVQPTVGVLSDRNTFWWGRRRPFILFGGTFIVIGMLMISNAETIGKWLDHSSNNTAAIAIAVVGFWILDLSNNTVQGPCRALLVDVAPLSQQNLGGSFFSFMLGAGNLAGYFIGSQSLTKVFPFFGTDVRALFSIGIVVLIICLSITLIFTREVPLRKEEVQSTENPFKTLIKGIRYMPKALARVCIVQFFAWLGWFTFLLYITSWVGENVFHGDPNAPDGSPALELFKEGVRYGSLGLTVFAIVTTVCSMIIPFATRLVGIKVVFCVCQLVLAASLGSSFFVTTKIGALVLIGACGIPWTAVMVLPFTLVALSVPESESGMYMGVLNIFVVIPQIIVALGIGFVIEKFSGNLAAALTVGAVSALISAVAVWFLIINESRPQKGKEMDSDETISG